MPNDLDRLSAERDTLLAKLKSLDRLRRGSLSRQVFAKKQAGQTRTQGPYYILQGFHKGKKFSHRVPTDQAQQVQQHVDNFKQFQDLADQCITLTDQITQLAESSSARKKNSRVRKSKPSDSGKPRPS